MSLGIMDSRAKKRKKNYKEKNIFFGNDCCCFFFDFYFLGRSHRKFTKQKKKHNTRLKPTFN